MTLASFLSSGTQHAILNGFAYFAFVLWLSLGYWTYGFDRNPWRLARRGVAISSLAARCVR